MPLLQPIDDAIRQVTADTVFLAQENEQNGKHEDKSLVALFRISGALQTSLDIHLVLQAFYDGLIELFGNCALEYSREESKLKLQHGSIGRHRCQYQLTLHGKGLGELILSRRKRFQKSEIQLLENLICTLINPLNNALLYEEALAAALKDPLTNLNNRRAMEGTLTREVELAKRNRSPVSIIALDIDHFKKINDTYGHLAGDKVIVEIANVLEHAVRSCDIVFRYGGEEFVVVLSSTDTEGALLLAERVRKTISSKCIQYEDEEISVTASLGVASYETGETDRSLLARADTALYEAKNSGRNCTKLSKTTSDSSNKSDIAELATSLN